MIRRCYIAGRMTGKISSDKLFQVFEQETDLSQDEQDLIKSAKEATEHSYSPYSGFRVGAAICLSNGSIITGSNQENASYPSGLCAERVAMFNFGTNFNDLDIKQIAVTAIRKSENKFLPVTPCGSCRQVMLEYEKKQNTPIQVVMQINNNQWVKAMSAKALLPFSFDQDSL